MVPWVDMRRARLSLVWMVSLALGLSLTLRTSSLPNATVPLTSALATSSQAVPAAPAGPAVAFAPASLLATTCRVPAEFGVPGIKALSHDIARHFHVAESVASSITRAAFAAADLRGLDPVLVLAVAAVESKFKPSAVNPSTGAVGLMQVMTRWHQDKISKVGGEDSMVLIAPNLKVGTAILADYLDAQNGDVDDALTRYLGASGAQQYLKRVHDAMARWSKLIKPA